MVIEIAATEAIDWMTNYDDSDSESKSTGMTQTQTTLAFGIPEPSTADQLVDSIDSQICGR